MDAATKTDFNGRTMAPRLTLDQMRERLMKIKAESTYEPSRQDAATDMTEVSEGLTLRYRYFVTGRAGRSGGFGRHTGTHGHLVFAQQVIAIDAEARLAAIAAAVARCTTLEASRRVGRQMMQVAVGDVLLGRTLCSLSPGIVTAEDSNAVTCRNCCKYIGDRR